MKNLVWLTDIHLDHIEKRDPAHAYDPIINFARQVLQKNPDGIIITGDISNAQRIEDHFKILMREWKNVPVYFILGNHDYYGGSFNAVDSNIKNLVANSNFHYLTNEKVIELTPTTAIVGHNGWYDGGYADWFKPGVVIMQDYYLISDYAAPGKLVGQANHIYKIMQKKAAECQQHILLNVANALQKYKKVIFATHVPPFDDAAVYNGKKSDWKWMPNFSSKLAGDGLKFVARQTENQNKEIIVLCGHTHGKWECHPTNNIVCYTGYSEYGSPLDSLMQIEVE